MKYYFEGYEILAPLSIISNEPVFDADTINLKKQRASQNAQRWEMSFNIATNDPSDILVNSIVNFDQVKTMIMPQLTSSKTFSVSSTPSVSSTASSGATSVVVSANGITGVLPKGYFIKFSNHPKIYMTTNQVDFSLSSTTVTIGVYPSLKSTVASGVNLLTEDNVVISYYREINDLRGIRYDDGILASAGTINIIEAV